MQTVRCCPFRVHNTDRSKDLMGNYCPEQRFGGKLHHLLRDID